MGRTYAHQEVNSDHQLESKQLAERLVAIELGFEDLVEAQARHDGCDQGDVMDELELLNTSQLEYGRNGQDPTCRW